MATHELLVNGQKRRVEAEPGETLLAVLRDRLDLTGTKYGCGEGMCGACTVLIGKEAVRSCTVTVASVAGKSVTTIEGLARNGKLHPVQQAFLDESAFQCGYCTPGMIMASVGMLNGNRSPGEDEIKRELQGNICRCGTYPRIVTAVRIAARGGSRG